jgi:hypothetical protein
MKNFISKLVNWKDKKIAAECKQNVCSVHEALCDAPPETGKSIWWDFDVVSRTCRDGKVLDAVLLSLLQLLFIFLHIFILHAS